MNPQLAAALAELSKMGLQLGAALLIARLTVDWALARYKSEKSWERETQAIADILVALAEMQRGLEQTLSAYAVNREVDTEPHLERYRNARRRLDEVGAIAALILEDEIHVSLDVLGSRLKTREDNWVADIASSIEAVSEARSQMVTVATARRRSMMSRGKRKASFKFWGH